MEIKPVSIVTIKNKIPLFKGDEKANSIELIEFEENGFQVVSQKDLYSVGDNAVYIQPDYCVPDTLLFESFLRPNGDAKKCKLGSQNRIRAIKFNLHKGDGLPVYSQGILLPYDEVQVATGNKTMFVDFKLDEDTLSTELGITKYVEPEDNGYKGGVNSGRSQQFPEGMYKTDETNINNLWHHIKFPIRLIGREKIDGSSITLYCREGKAGIASRNLDKPLVYKQITGKRKPTLFEKIKLLFGFKVDLFNYEEVESDSDFVKYGKPYLALLELYCKASKRNIALRGELSGGSLKGSGNKNNPARNEAPNIKFFGADIYDFNTIRLPEDEFVHIINWIEGSTCKRVFDKTFNSKEELENECNTYFQTNLIEGIVVRTPDHNFSAKCMNLAYDAIK